MTLTLNYKKNSCRRRAAIASTMFAILSLFVASAPLSAQNRPPTLTVEQLRDDFRVMRDALEESHVGLNWFISGRNLERRFQSLFAGLRRPLTAREFHRRLLPLVAALRHGHTTLELPVEGVGYRLRHLERNGKYFPFEVKALQNKLYLMTDLSEPSAFARGTEIVSINGRRVKAIMDEMALYQSADGMNETFKKYRLGAGFQFHYLLDLLYGPADSYVLEIIPFNEKTKIRRTVAAAPPERMAALYGARAGRAIDQFPPALRFETLGEKVGLLTVKSFYEGLFGPDAPDFNAFLAATFRRIKENEIEHLIIDVRGNEGGNGSYVPALYSYLADKPFRLSKPTLLSSAALSFIKYAENPGDDIKAFAAAPLDFVYRSKDGSWVLKEKFDEDRYKTVAPPHDRFNGKLYVLTDGGSFSATNEFLDLVYRYHRRENRSVLFVGEQNGGDNAFGFSSGGQILQIVLPHSKQKLRIPLLGGRQHFAGAVPKAVIPDRRVAPSMRDIVEGVDRELLFVRKTIAASRPGKD